MLLAAMLASSKHCFSKNPTSFLNKHEYIHWESCLSHTHAHTRTHIHHRICRTVFMNTPWIVSLSFGSCLVSGARLPVKGSTGLLPLCGAADSRPHCGPPWRASHVFTACPDLHVASVWECYRAPVFMCLWGFGSHEGTANSGGVQRVCLNVCA